MPNGNNPKGLSNSFPIRLYDEDLDALRKLADKSSDLFNKSVVDFIRECVEAGRPIVEKRYTDALNAQKKG